MKSALSLAAWSRILLMGAVVILLFTGCSKHADDCSAPETSEDQASTRTAAAVDGQSEINEGRPAGTSFRGVEGEDDDSDTDGDGISDDGDDEADGEGNKKVRPAN